MVLVGEFFFSVQFGVVDVVVAIIIVLSAFCIKGKAINSKHSKKTSAKTNEMVNNQCGCVNGDTEESFNVL